MGDSAMARVAMKDVRDFLIVLLLGAAALIVSDRIWFHGQYFERAQQNLESISARSGVAETKSWNVQRKNRGRRWTMRRFFGLVLLFVFFLAIDQAMFEGRYRDELWQSAKYQGQAFRLQTERWLKSFGL
jgi:hypothetical protein